MQNQLSLGNEEQQQPHMKVPVAEALEGLKELKNHMEAEMNSMNTNDVQDLEEISNGAKTVDCKWVYKTKCDSKGNVKRYKARLAAKGFTQRE